MNETVIDQGSGCHLFVRVHPCGSADVGRRRGDRLLWSQGVPRACTVGMVLDSMFYPGDEWMARIERALAALRETGR